MLTSWRYKRVLHNAVMPTPAPATTFASLFARYHSMSQLRRPNLNDVQSDAIEGSIMPAFDAMMDARPSSPAELMKKSNAVLAEYGEVDAVPTYLVRKIVGDMGALYSGTP